jgi:hypothetical protein
MTIIFFFKLLFTSVIGLYSGGVHPSEPFGAGDREWG